MEYDTVVRRYDFICSVGCYYHWTGKKHTCTDCAARYVAEVRESCQWDHSVLLLGLNLKILRR